MVLIMSIKDLLSSPDKWTKNAYSRDINDKQICGTDCELDENAVKWCLAGAIGKIYKHDKRKIFDIHDKIYKKLQKENKGTILVYNDHKDTKFEDIRNLIIELDI